MQERGIELIEVEGGVAEVTPSQLVLADGRKLPHDECLWCTQAGAAPWVAASGLPTDEGGHWGGNGDRGRCAGLLGAERGIFCNFMLLVPHGGVKKAQLTPPHALKPCSTCWPPANQSASWR